MALGCNIRNYSTVLVETLAVQIFSRFEVIQKGASRQPSHSFNPWSRDSPIFGAGSHFHWRRARRKRFESLVSVFQCIAEADFVAFCSSTLRLFVANCHLWCFLSTAPFLLHTLKPRRRFRSKEEKKVSVEAKLRALKTCVNIWLVFALSAFCFDCDLGRCNSFRSK